ncbi:hypothetical protein TCE0_013f00897 [Talaromyces pinophilus]|uniref:Uncharacterized protein n=1 Tax=Talaromyces pinophilus TaxID=128442 RepID=A0A698XKQ8_TALPI|nr:hypothetical protein TCE0_013f00897 [Talaromyces pinophilus]
MDFTAQDLVYYLSAAAGAMSQDHMQHGIYLVYEEDGELIEKLWTGSEIKDQVLIAENRLVFCVDAQDFLRCHEYNPDDEEWSEVVLNGGQAEEHGILIPPNSKLSGCFTSKGGQILFFQSSSGDLQGIVIEDNSKWEYLQDPIPAKPLDGTPHSVIATSTDQNIGLFYLSRVDNRMHHLFTEGTAEWHDTILQAPEINDSVANFVVIPRDDGRFETILLVTDKIVRIDAEGLKIDMGNVVDGQFVPTSSKECIIESISLVKKGIEAVASSKVAGPQKDKSKDKNEKDKKDGTK